MAETVFRVCLLCVKLYVLKHSDDLGNQQTGMVISLLTPPIIKGIYQKKDEQ